MKSDDIVLVTYEDEHWYKIVDRDQTYFIPSVTTKLGVKDKPFLARWRGDIGNREADLRMNEASQRGKRVHWAKETLLRGGVVVYDPWQNPVYTIDGIKDLEKQFKHVATLRVQDEMLQVHKIKQQLDILKPEVLAVEMTVYDLDELNAGTVDAVYAIKPGNYMIAGAKPLYLEGGIYIEDLKTGNVVDDSVWMQLAPYLVCYEKMSGNSVKGALVTHTGAKTRGGIAGLTTLFRSREDLILKDYPDYRHASSLWLRDHAEDQPKQYQFPAILTLGGN